MQFRGIPRLLADKWRKMFYSKLRLVLSSVKFGERLVSWGYLNGRFWLVLISVKSGERLVFMRSCDVKLIYWITFIKKYLIFQTKTVMLRTPVGFGALQRTTCYSYLRVYCVDSKMGDPQLQLESTLSLSFMSYIRQPPSQRSTRTGKNVQNIKQEQV